MILPLEKQVVSLELSKWLKKLGVPQDSLFFWRKDVFINSMAGKNDFTGQLEEYPTQIKWVLALSRESDGEIYSAFTVAELGEMIPYPFRTYKTGGENCDECPATWGWHVSDAEGFIDAGFGCPFTTEADARAKMLINLIERGTVKP